MYGLVIEGVQFFVESEYGSENLQLSLKQAQLDTVTFSTHERYSERIVPNILSAIVGITGESVENVGILAGRYFVQYMVLNGYGPLLRVMGRKFSDFVKGMDNLHEYFRFSYPRLSPPSFYATKETTTGLLLYYRSRRRGYISYVVGQLIEVARLFYQTDVTVTILKKEERGSFQFVTMGIRFDNSVLAIDRKLREKSASLMEYMPVDSVEFLKMFPFFLAFDKHMKVQMAGPKLLEIMPDIIGAVLPDQFDLQRPAVKFSHDGLMAHLNNLFQMESLFPIQRKVKQKAISFVVNDVLEDKVGVPNNENEVGEPEYEDADQNLPYLILNGPMLNLKNHDLLLYLPTIFVTNLDDLFAVGLYLQDYGDADCYKEILMATVQKSDDLKDMLKAEKERSVQLALMMKEIEATRKTARDLLTSMLPRSVATELLTTGTASTTVESFDNVTLAFLKVCDFLKLTVKLEASQIVSLLNVVYSSFDAIITRHGVYKVETVGESYLISSGVPIRNEYHAEYVADTALDCINDIKLIDFAPLGGRGKIQVKIGINSGPIVGAVVGKRAPRYCLFGDTVNTASRMESHNKMPMTIQCGQASKDCMEACARGKFKFKHRGVVNLKGKGETKTYTLVSKAGRPRYMTNPLVEFANDDDTGNLNDHQEDGEMNYTPMDDDGDRSANESRMSLSAMSHQYSSQGVSRNTATGSRLSNAFEEEDFGLKGLVSASPAVDGSLLPDIGLGSNIEDLIENQELLAQRKAALGKKVQNEEKQRRTTKKTGSAAVTSRKSSDRRASVLMPNMPKDAPAEVHSPAPQSRPASGRPQTSGSTRRQSKTTLNGMDIIKEAVKERLPSPGPVTRQPTIQQDEDQACDDEIRRLVDPPSSQLGTQPTLNCSLDAPHFIERANSPSIKLPSPTPSPPLNKNLEHLDSNDLEPQEERLATPTPSREPKARHPMSPVIQTLPAAPLRPPNEIVDKARRTEVNDILQTSTKLPKKGTKGGPPSRAAGDALRPKGGVAAEKDVTRRDPSGGVKAPLRPITSESAPQENKCPLIKSNPDCCCECSKVAGNNWKAKSRACLVM